MIYSYYKYSRNLAWEILIKENICSYDMRRNCMSLVKNDRKVPIFRQEFFGVIFITKIENGIGIRTKGSFR